MNKVVSFFYFDKYSTEWKPISLEELSTLNDPEILIVPIFEDGSHGEQTTWKVWHLSQQIKIVQDKIAEIDNERKNMPETVQKRLREKKEKEEDQAKQEQLDAEQDELQKLKRELFLIEPKKKELKKIENLPPEVRAPYFILNDEDIKGLIKNATSLFETAGKLLQFILVINVIAIFVFGIVLIMSFGC